jgi:hypothetical protein
MYGLIGEIMSLCVTSTSFLQDLKHSHRLQHLWTTVISFILATCPLIVELKVRLSP